MAEEKDSVQKWLEELGKIPEIKAHGAYSSLMNSYQPGQSVDEFKSNLKVFIKEFNKYYDNRSSPIDMAGKLKKEDQVNMAGLKNIVKRYEVRVEFSRNMEADIIEVDRVIESLKSVQPGSNSLNITSHSPEATKLISGINKILEGGEAGSLDTAKTKADRFRNHLSNNLIEYKKLITSVEDKIWQRYDGREGVVTQEVSTLTTQELITIIKKEKEEVVYRVLDEIIEKDKKERGFIPSIKRWWAEITEDPLKVQQQKIEKAENLIAKYAPGNIVDDLRILQAQATIDKAELKVGAILAERLYSHIKKLSSLDNINLSPMDRQVERQPAVVPQKDNRPTIAVDRLTFPRVSVAVSLQETKEKGGRG